MSRWLLALLFLSTPSTVSASVVEALELVELTSEADAIVVGTVTGATSDWDSWGRIVTDFQVRVEERLKGTVSSTFTLRVLGGSIGNLGMRVEGEPVLRVGERALFFARVAADETVHRPVGMSQGVMLIRDQAGATVVQPGGGGTVLVRQSATGQLLEAPGALMRERPLEALLRDIRGFVARGNRP